MRTVMAGFSCHLTKPIDADQLRDAIQSAMRG
jgi:CheY-like chemotaxis protein